MRARWVGHFAELIVVMGVAVSGFGQGAGPSAGGGAAGSGGGSRQPSAASPDSRVPVVITGRILSDLDRPISDAVSLQLVCGLRTVQSVHTDLDGYFSFNIGSGSQDNFDFSAANSDPQFAGSAASQLGVPARYGENVLAGCELHIAAGSYYPVIHSITEPAQMGRLDLGTLHVSHIGGTEQGAVSVSELSVPKNAKSEYEKGIKDVHNGKLDSALPHLQKAVSLYDAYPTAWNELGQIYDSLGMNDQAAEAYQKAIAADPHFVPPLLGLATQQIHQRDWKHGADTAERALDLDSGLSYAHFLAAVGEFNLHNLTDAERNAQEAAKDSGANMPEINALLAQIYVQKKDYAQALNYMQAYLHGAPNGPYAEQIRKNLPDVQQLVGTQEQPETAAAKPGS